MLVALAICAAIVLPLILSYLVYWDICRVWEKARKDIRNYKP